MERHLSNESRKSEGAKTRNPGQAGKFELVGPSLALFRAFAISLFRDCSALSLICLVSLVGCEPAGAAVSGKVTLDASLLDDATITFVPIPGNQRQAAWP